MNKVDEYMNSLVKYMIKGDCNITIDNVTFMNQVDDDMISVVKYMIKEVPTLS